MLRQAVLTCLLLMALARAAAQQQPSKGGVPVEVVATASEYVPRSTTISHPGHAYTNCEGSTSYFGQFSNYGYSGSISGTAETNTQCSTTFSPPAETTLTTYRRVNYTIAKGEQGLYLLSCTQTWKLTARERALIAVMAGAEGVSGNDSGNADKATARAKGTWTECPAFEIGSQYTLTVRNTSDARLEDIAGAKATKPYKLEYLSSRGLPVPSPHSLSPPQTQPVSTPAAAKVHDIIAERRRNLR
jgi:hypothetical protein